MSTFLVDSVANLFAKRWVVKKRFFLVTFDVQHMTTLWHADGNESSAISILFAETFRFVAFDFVLMIVFASIHFDSDNFVTKDGALRCPTHVNAIRELKTYLEQGRSTPRWKHPSSQYTFTSHFIRL